MNFFLRAGLRTTTLPQSAFHRLGPRDLLVVDLPMGAALDEHRLEPYLNAACRVLFTGNLASVAALFGLQDPKWIRPSSPYNCFGCTVGDRTTPLQPPHWGLFLAQSSGDVEFSGNVFEIAGDRLSPSSALRVPIEGGFLIAQAREHKPDRYFLNGLPFAALQSWLQGQEDLVQWFGWNSRQHWLDDYVDILIDALPPTLIQDDAERIDSIAPFTICLRHDNDDSTDSQFAELEGEAGVSATYALLDDANLPAWRRIAELHPEHEYSLHYTTIEPRYRMSKYFAYALSKTPFRHMLNQYDTGRAVLGDGKLIAQVKKAQAAGIGTTTLHRHFAYLPYPEIIDALHGVYAQQLGVTATSSFFRGNIYRWGMDELDGAVSTTAPWPDAQFPYWMPFRLAHAARRGEILPGWECSLLMESEPEFVDQVLKVRHKNLTQKFLMLCYHPANSRNSVLCEGGTLRWLQSCIRIGRENGYEFSRFDTYVSQLDAGLDRLAAGETR